jgi:hypothetical protein
VQAEQEKKRRALHGVSATNANGAIGGHRVRVYLLVRSGSEKGVYSEW